MANNVFAVSVALNIVSSASHDLLASCNNNELVLANLAIANALLLRGSTQVEGDDVGPVEDEVENIVAKMTETVMFPITTKFKNPQTQSRVAGGKQRTLQTCKMWLSRSENIVAHLAQEWLRSRIAEWDGKSGRHGVSKAVIGNSPALLSLLKRIMMKRRRSSTRV
ncbi:hypothetical protein EK21DRAFT_93731 [Setomelanomma holmii]|uniref:Uncharacterized protein n=1 Tax=Setomelanomma holmii TaxID=210430 RepID=A0A9P4H0K9_9PLEO|nr:hypothetical protein EK21DRAFT_93731 [Setomelanomma holmii]